MWQRNPEVPSVEWLWSRGVAFGGDFLYLHSSAWILQPQRPQTLSFLTPQHLAQVPACCQSPGVSVEGINEGMNALDPDDCLPLSKQPREEVTPLLQSGRPGGLQVLFSEPLTVLSLSSGPLHGQVSLPKTHSSISPSHAWPTI